jgi:p-hydroxybenzoate 3-monooxygenase
MEAEMTSVGVVVVGAGPAGLLLANRVLLSGVDCLVLERRSREAFERLSRAGLLEHRTVELLRRHGLAAGLERDGRRHGVCEFRRPQSRLVLRYGELAGGRPHWVYPQHMLVRDLLATFLDRGGEVVFGAEELRLADLDLDRPTVSYAGPAGGRSVRCHVVAGCDGVRSACRQAVGIDRYQHDYGVSWLALLAAAPPSADWNVYGLHPDGFAGHMMRSPKLSRYYLQCEPGAASVDWPPERIWETLSERLGSGGRWPVAEGPILEVEVLELRAMVCDTMRYGRLFLAGDAAHLLPPAGAKGMNLALADADELATALTPYFQSGDETALGAYSARCLRRVWQAQELSRWLVEFFHNPPSGLPDQLRQARLDLLADRSSFATGFAERYVGVA